MSVKIMVSFRCALYSGNVRYALHTLCPKEHDAYIQVVIAMTKLIRNNYPIKLVNWNLFGISFAVLKNSPSGY